MRINSDFWLNVLNVLLFFLLIYVLSYFLIRQSHIEFIGEDQSVAVIFQDKQTYLSTFYLPLISVDKAMTRMQFYP